MFSLSANAKPFAFAPHETKTPKEEGFHFVITTGNPKPTMEARWLRYLVVLDNNETAPEKLSAYIYGYKCFNPLTGSTQWRIPNPLFPDAVSEVDGSLSGVPPLATHVFSIPLDVFADAKSWHWSVIKTA